MAIRSKRINSRERFDNKWTPEPYSGCWLWMGADSGRQGYGGFQLEGKWHRAHRASWKLYRGPIPSDKFVCHRCDTPACVNPDHLFLGTASENALDAFRKGRIRRDGERNNNNKISSSDAIAIRLDVSSPGQIARRYGISTVQVWNIRTKKQWQNV